MTSIRVTITANKVEVRHSILYGLVSLLYCMKSVLVVDFRWVEVMAISILQTSENTECLNQVQRI